MNLEFLGKYEDIKAFWNQGVRKFTVNESAVSSLPSAVELLKFLTGHIDNLCLKPPIEIKINASRIDQSGIHQQHLDVSIHDAMNLFNKGYTLCLGDMSSKIKVLSDLKKEAENIFDYSELIAITGYLSPASSVGVLHFDRQHNFFIQRQGVKNWSVSEISAIANPFENVLYAGLTKKHLDSLEDAGYKINLPNSCGCVEFNLQPGEILYVPPGFYHSPETLNSISLHYTLTIEPANFWKDFNKQLFSQLLSSKGLFFQDYRFMNDLEKELLFQKCMTHLLEQNQFKF